MYYRHDPDLDFLRHADNDDLDALLRVLTVAPDGTPREDERITAAAPYRENQPNHSVYWELMAGELQRQGGYELVNNLVRGGAGIKYERILDDLCSAAGLDTNASVPEKERRFVVDFLGHLLEAASAEVLEDFCRAVGIPSSACSRGEIRRAVRRRAERDASFAERIFAEVAELTVQKRERQAQVEKQWHERGWADALINLQAPEVNWALLWDRRRKKIGDLLPRAVVQVAYMRRKQHRPASL